MAADAVGISCLAADVNPAKRSGDGGSPVDKDSALDIITRKSGGHSGLGRGVHCCDLSKTRRSGSTTSDPAMWLGSSHPTSRPRAERAAQLGLEAGRCFPDASVTSKTE